MKELTTRNSICASLALVALTVSVHAGSTTWSAGANPSGFTTETRTLEQCLSIAMETNHRRPASMYAVAAAEAQHKQALSGYWPQLKLQGAYELLDEAPDYIYPETAVAVPAMTVVSPESTATITVPAGVLGATAIELPVNVPAQTITTQAQTLTVDEQNIKLSDRSSFYGSAEAKWLVFDGGMRRGLREQAKGGIAAAKAEVRRTDLDIQYSVTRMYYGAVLARQLHKVGSDTLARMEATLNLTETMYKEGSGTVKKTDFLDNKIMVASLRAMVAKLEKNQTMSQAALANTMGLPWQTSIRPASKQIPYEVCANDLEQLVGTAYEFNPDWEKLEAGIRAFEGGVRTAKSGYYPKVALTGEVHKWWNDYNGGTATDANKQGWSVGVGVEVPIFSGFLTKNKVAEARARVSKLKEEQFLLKEGIGLMVKNAVVSLTAVEHAHLATLTAMKSATENRDLNTRAYQSELVETGDVVRSQLVEALMTAQHLKNRFDLISLQAQINHIVGTEVRQQIGL